MQLASGNPIEENAIRKAQEMQESWNKTAEILAIKTDRPVQDTVFKSSNWDHRRKKEVSELIDLSQTLNEKYGPEFGFQLGLRQKENKVVVKYGMPVRAKEHDPALTAINIDDRTR